MGSRLHVRGGATAHLESQHQLDHADDNRHRADIEDQRHRTRAGEQEQQHAENERCDTGEDQQPLVVDLLAQAYRRTIATAPITYSNAIAVIAGAMNV